MDSFTVGWLLGCISGAIAYQAGLWVYGWWHIHKVARSRIELDDYTARLRALDRHPRRIE